MRFLAVSLITTVFVGCVARGETVRLGDDEALAKGRGTSDCSPREATLGALNFTRAWNTGNESEVASMVAEKAVIGLGKRPGLRLYPVGPEHTVELLRERHKHKEHIDLLELKNNGAHRPAVVPEEVGIVFRFTIRSDDRQLNLQPRTGKGGLGCKGAITRWVGEVPLG